MRRITSFILAILVFGIGLLAGAAVSIQKRARDFSAAVERRLAQDAAGSSNSLSRSRDPVARFTSEDDLLTAIMSAVSEKDPFLRAYQLREGINSLSSEQLALIFKRALQIDNREQRDLLLVPLISRWVDIDRSAALAAVKPYRDLMNAVWRVPWRSVEFSINEALAKALPASTLADAAAAPNAWWALSTAQAALATLADGDPAKQLVELAKIPNSKLRDDLCHDALLELAKKDFKAAEAQLDLIADPRTRSRTRTALLGTLAEKDPASAIDRMVELAPEIERGNPGIELVNKVLRAAAKQNGSDSLSSVERLPKDLQSYALGAVLVGWAENHPAEALEWAAANNVNIQDTKALVYFDQSEGAGYNSLISIAFDSDREKTLAWIRSQPPSAERDSLLRGGIWNGTLEQRMAIYAELTPNSRSKAVREIMSAGRGISMSETERWVQALPEGRERNAGIQAFALMQANNNPDSVESIAANWPAGAERDSAFRGIASSIGQNDPIRGLEFARQITERPLECSHCHSVVMVLPG